METSEDEDKKKKEAAEKAKKPTTGLTPEDLDTIVDISLKETNTITMMVIPGVMVNDELAEEIKSGNERYDALRKNKIGSDSYMIRGSQTLNLT